MEGEAVENNVNTKNDLHARTERIDVQKRLNNFQEYINKRALLEWVRITGYENPHKWKYDKLLSNLANVILGYPSEGKPAAFTWPTGAGNHKGIPAIRAKVSYEFWKYFMSEGRKRLAEYNKEKGTKIAVLKELTIKNSDQNNLGLLLRMKITDIYKAKGKPVPDMFIRRGMLHIGKSLVLRPAVAAMKLNIKIPEWRGLPYRALMTEKEKEEFDSGAMKRGDLVLPGLEVISNESTSEVFGEQGGEICNDIGSTGETHPSCSGVTSSGRKRTLLGTLEEENHPTKRSMI